MLPSTRASTVTSSLSQDARVDQPDAAPVVEVRDLVMHFPVRGPWRGPKLVVHAVDNVSFSIAPGETLGLVGESGCGKSTVGRCILRLLEPTSGSIRLRGVDITHLNARQLRPMRRLMHIVFQDPYSSLNPRMTVNHIVAGPLRYHGLASHDEVRQRVSAILQRVGLSDAIGQRYPRNLSGGQRQRVALARALVAEPALIIADEPISALDTSVQATIINLLLDLQRSMHFSCLFITHDLSAAEVLCHRIAVMHLGQIVEIGSRQEVLSSPKHPYTQSLMSAVLVPDPARQRTQRQIVLEGDLPSPIEPPSGCRFRTRCPIADARCALEEPTLAFAGSSGHLASCLFIGPDGRAPVVAPWIAAEKTA